MSAKYKFIGNYMEIKNDCDNFRIWRLQSGKYKVEFNGVATRFSVMDDFGNLVFF
jgi:hypothetical protein